MGAGDDPKPYPDLLIRRATARRTEVHRRPLRAEDEPLLQDLAAHTSAEDLRLRFFAALRGLSHAVAERLAHVDYDRAMALLAETDGVALGVARFHAQPNRRSAEHAIAVRTDWKGRGLGVLVDDAADRSRARMESGRAGWRGVAGKHAHAADVPRAGLQDRCRSGRPQPDKVRKRLRAGEPRRAG